MGRERCGCLSFYSYRKCPRGKSLTRDPRKAAERSDENIIVAQVVRRPVLYQYNLAAYKTPSTGVCVCVCIIRWQPIKICTKPLFFFLSAVSLSSLLSYFVRPTHIHARPHIAYFTALSNTDVINRVSRYRTPHCPRMTIFALRDKHRPIT